MTLRKLRQEEETYMSSNQEVTDFQRQMKVAEEQRRQAQEQLRAEVEFFTEEILKGLEEPTAQTKQLVRVMSHSLVAMLRGFKLRIEQFGASVTRLGALTQQAWDTTQVTIEAFCRLEAQRHQQALELKTALSEAALRAAETDSTADIFHLVSESVHPEMWGLKDHVEANELFGECQRSLLEKAKQAQAAGTEQSPEAKAQEILKKMVRGNPESIQNLPSMQKFMKNQGKKN